MGHFSELAGRVLLVWALALVGNVAFYGAVTASVAGTFRLFWAKGLKQYKIQQREASPADMRRETATSLRTLLVYSFYTTAVYFGAVSGLFTVYPSIKTLGVLYLLVSVAAMIVAHDAHFYWSHRLLHHRLLFSRFHRAHHKSITPTTFACLAFHEGEAFVQGLFLPLWLIVVPMQLAGLIIALTLMLVRTALGHSGVELFPARVAGRWLVTNTHHDLHHMTGHHNYGLYFTFWDRLMSTEHPTSERKAGATVPISLGA